MEVSRSCVSSGGRSPGMVGGLCCLSVPIATHRAVASTVGMGQFFGMVKHSQECQLAMPVLCPAALFFRRRLSASNRSAVDSGD